MENLKTNAVLYLELILMKMEGMDSEDFDEKYGSFFRTAYKMQEEQVSDAWCVGNQQALADDSRNNQVSYFLDYDHYIKATYGSI